MPAIADRPLSVRVRADTRAYRAAAQASGFLDALVAGRLPRDAYADLAAQHWFVYRELERAAPAVPPNPFLAPELDRLAALAADLRFLPGPAWQRRIDELPATGRYREGLHAVASGRPAAFVAHHYTRYLGDLSGGQSLGPAIARADGLGGEGHRFCTFEDIDASAFRNRYRGLLDRVAWPAEERDMFVAEGYRLNIAVLRELKQRWA